MRDVFAAAAQLAAAGDAPIALATVIHTSGSTYRKPGAHMVVAASGRYIGSLSGGCLEGDVAEIAREVAASKQPRLLLYDTTADDDLVWGMGMGCNGIVEVFVEPFDWDPDA